MSIVEELKEKIYEAVQGINQNNLGIAFSGGVDSSTLAASCRAQGKKAVLITVGFLSSKDIEASKEVAEDLGLKMISEVISSLEEIEDCIRSILKVIKFDRLVLLENCVCFYYVFKTASEHGVRTVLSANGMDELFCGYDLYRKYVSDEEKMRKIMDLLVETARRDKLEIDKIAALWSINYECPFLSDNFVKFAMKIPIEYKIKGEDDELRKHILRETALEMRIPKSAATRRKKAFQYSSGIHKALSKLAKLRGYTKSRAKSLGYEGSIEAYLKDYLS